MWALTLSGHTLSFYNWTGSTLWNGGTGVDTDKVFLFPTIDPGDLNKISFYSGNGGAWWMWKRKPKAV
jgi:hypothetical protein